ncbi:MAG: hypothetical protein K1V67_07155, partial [Paramuribaculum intestinale]
MSADTRPFSLSSTYGRDGHTTPFSLNTPRIGPRILHRLTVCIRRRPPAAISTTPSNDEDLSLNYAPT